MKSGLAELPHPAPDKPVSPYSFSGNRTLNEFSSSLDGVQWKN
ncbi:hypothetical protein [Xenorhabdus bovienii]|nr:hypothetical protein [Xenorhabdus bovienii]